VKRLVLTLVALAACGSPSPEPAPPVTDVAHAPDTSHEVDWSYEGETGPSHWGELSAEFATCAAGTRQSPVDLDDSTPQDLPDVVFDYRPSPARILHNGDNVQVEVDPGNRIAVDGDSYELVQFHFHAPSEHTVAGDQADAELHLVHANTIGELAVVGVLIREGAENAAVGPFWEQLPAVPTPARPLDADVAPEALLPADRNLVRYDGSLTTPPCTEGVRWIVMTEAVEMSPDQLATLTDIIAGNHRPVQPRNDRPIEVDASTAQPEGETNP
jgi:carbonic anhydrase